MECGGTRNKNKFVSSKCSTDILEYLIQCNDLISWFISLNWSVSCSQDSVLTTAN